MLNMGIDTMCIEDLRPGTSVSPIPDTLFQRAWTAMRIKQSFTAADLALVAAKDTEVHAVQSITRFLHRLAASGYLYTYKRRRAGYKQYRLIRNTGEFSPAFRRAGGVYDRNLKELQK